MGRTMWWRRREKRRRGRGEERGRDVGTTKGEVELLGESKEIKEE